MALGLRMSLRMANNTRETYGNLSTEAFMTEAAVKLTDNGHGPETNDVNSHTEAIAAFNYDVENNKNEKEARESRALLPFCIVFGFGSLFSSSVQTYMTSQITVLEKTLGLTSSQSGILLSANDIGFVATVLIASHFLHRYHIPRILGVCILVFGLSGILTALPHFILQEKMPYQNRSLTNSTDNENNSFLCVERTNNFTKKTDCSAQRAGSVGSQSDTKWVLGYIAAMMVIQGIAKSTRQPLSTTYVDNNAKRDRTGFYVGILSTFGIFGPMIAITAGGLFNKLPVDLKESTLQPEDPRWIGAWWLGFIVFGSCAVLISFPIFCFPAGSKKPRNKAGGERTKEVKDSEEASCLSRLGDLPRSILRVLSSSVYTLSLIAVLFQIFAVMSLGAFGPKYIENQFRIPTWKANLIIGPEKLVTTVLGTFGGGLLTRRLKLGVTGCIKLAVIVRAISLALNCFNFIFGCDNPPIIGLDTDNSDAANLSCNCNGVSYLPVCADGRTFFSPCHAGCQVETQAGFSQCLGSLSGNITPGLCDSGCMYLIPFVVTNAISSLLSTLVIAPSYVIVLRSVHEKDRSMAVGLLSFLMSLLVFLPAPIVYGKLFDSMCLTWTNNCGDKGSCSLYDVAGMRLKFNATDVSLRIGCVLFTLMALFCAGRTTYEDDSALNIEKETKSSSAEAIQMKTPNSCGQNHATNPMMGDSDVNSGYVNVCVSQESSGERKQKPLPPTPDKPPKPSPRQSRDPVWEK